MMCIPLGIRLIHSVGICLPNFFPGCFCKGFDSYDSAWDFLLDVLKEAEHVSAMLVSSVPSESPDITIPPEPTVVARDRDNVPPSITQGDPNVIP